MAPIALASGPAWGSPGCTRRAASAAPANTRRDGEEFLALAARHPLRVVTTPYPFSAADIALADVETDAVHGAAVLHVDPDDPLGGTNASS